MNPRFIPVVLLLLLAVFHGQLWWGRGSVPHVTELRQQIDLQKASNADAKRANERLASEVRNLKEGMEMVEARARQELGMVKPHEIFVQISK